MLLWLFQEPNKRMVIHYGLGLLALRLFWTGITPGTQGCQSDGLKGWIGIVLLYLTGTNRLRLSISELILDS